MPVTGGLRGFMRDTTTDGDDLLPLLHERFPHGVVERDGRIVGFWSSVGERLGKPTMESLGRSATGEPASFQAVPVGDAPAIGAWFRDALADPASVDAGGRPGVVRGVRRVDFVHTLRALESNLSLEQMRSRAPVRELIGTLGGARSREDGTALVALHGADVARDFVRFVRTLDWEAVECCLPRCRDLRLREAHWPGLDASFVTGAPLRRAMAAEPHHADTLLDAWARDPDAFRATLSRNGARKVVTDHLVAVGDWPSRLARHHDLALAAWDDRCAAGRRYARPPRHGRPGRYPRVDLLAASVARLAALPASWVPSSDDEWAAFLDLGPLLDDVALHTPLDDFVAFLDVRGRWVEWSARLRATSGCPAEGLATAFQGSVHMAAALARQVVAPALALRIGRGGDDVPSKVDHFRLWRASSVGRTLNSILEASAQWHARQGAMLDAIEALPGEASRRLDGWAPGLPDHVHGGVTLKVLTTPRELRDEGSRGRDGGGVDGLAHCVGGHAPGCRSGRSRIVSLRRNVPGGAFVRLSTADLDVTRAHIRVTEHRGLRNGSPPDECVAALEAYVAAASEGAGVEREAFAPMDGWDDPVSMEAGYDVWREGNHAAVVAMWDPLLPRRMRGMGVEGWVAVVDGILR